MKVLWIAAELVMNFYNSKLCFEAGHGSREVWGMHCLHSLGSRDLGSNPTQGMDVWCLCVYVRFSVFVYR
jgi:hypothetical protein